MIKLADRRIGVLIVGLLAWPSLSWAAMLPAGFSEVQVAGGLANPTAMAFAPDGRLFVCQQGGQVRVIKNGALLPTPFVSLTVNASGERGLLGIAFDPDFASNQFIYLYYTATSPTLHNRVSRFTANGDVAIAGSETVVLDLDDLSGATNHNGGALHFGLDDKLYVAVGENAFPDNAQSYGNLLGKMLRINTDGSIPPDNPFLGSTTGRNRAIWALGLRNPFTFAIDPVTGRMFINDVGQSTWEEINDGIAGSNYGWPATEGPTSDPRFRAPIHAYSSSSVDPECAITGGVFYRALTPTFPSEYIGDYFFADHCVGWIKRLNPTTKAVSNFAFGVSAPVDLQVGADGSLYYLARGSGGSTGVVYRISYTGNDAPAITEDPASQTASAGQSVTFRVTASGSEPLNYQWQRNGVDIGGATSSTYTIASVAIADNGARFRCRVSNQAGSTLSNEAILTVTGNSPPTATITQPAAGLQYTGDATITFAGTGTDPEDGTLAPGAFTWRVDFHHDDHTHPTLQPTTGVTGGSFTVPKIGETSANVFYRIHLTVVDSAGLTHSVSRDVLPRTLSVTLAASRPGVQLTLDGQTVRAPHTFTAVVGMERQIGAPAEFKQGSTTYIFLEWSDGGAMTHSITLRDVPSATYTARYQRQQRR